MTLAIVASDLVTCSQDRNFAKKNTKMDRYAHLKIRKNSFIINKMHVTNKTQVFLQEFAVLW